MLYYNLSALLIIEMLSTRLTRAERNERENNHVSDQLLELVHFPLGKKLFRSFHILVKQVKAYYCQTKPKREGNWWTFHNPKG